ncbi:Golgi complex subunit 7 [Seminavis robusta]|uniref:Conserved oligomeric Golgi complex subunit 7 n=1 Tax=Seminavis robusta TaxID=568900 RepID=A0A9N8HDX2_9STRA|nr:Golgi complex subunit 7 [Seminavis robusta]|eukprot:Sro361_g126610.1 Golgi complex subunit 7 (931) ;mRNA; f:53980-56863
MSKPNIASPPASRGMTPEETLEQQLTAMLNSPGEEFSVATYLNLALDDSGEDLQQRMAELALQFQLSTQSCHEEIGRIGAELQAILPRCHADVGRVGVGLDGMKQDAAALLESTSMKSETEEEVSTSLETLSTLHALQSNFSRTKEILTAAATWDSTLSSVAPLLAEQNLTEAVNALAQLENGERALRGMPNPEERHESIAKIRQQVQVLLQPQLKHALQNMNTRLAPLQQCVSLYMKLGKMDALKEEYVKNRPLAVHKAWFDYTPSYEPTGGANAAALAEGGGTDALRNQDKVSNFLTWLPGWYETVLNLITEERRQALAVFGPTMVPEICTKVIQECFRPILPSFQSRLESLYSAHLTGPSKGSLESICAVYEATLQFLALAYENVAGGWLDLMESSNATNMEDVNGLGLYKDMTAFFFQVASPFALYQERLSSLETKHSSVAAKLVADDIKQAVSAVSEGGSADLACLQDATDRLKGLTTFVFPLAEGALARFELMNGGFHVEESLTSVDGLIAGHASKIASAIQSLSSSMTSNEDKLADNFDDQHVLCALEVLKVAGSFKRRMKVFEGKTQERIKVLAERMAAFSAKEKKIEDTLSGAAKTSSDGPFTLPDALSVVEIDSFLTKAVCGSGDSHVDEDANNVTLELLQRLAGVSTDSAVPTETPVVLYKEVDAAMIALTTSCHAFVYDVCSAVPRKHLRGISTMASWKEESGNDDLASYGTLPQTYITQVGEHMLALVQALEPFASDAEALSLANEVMDGVRDVALQYWREFLASAGSMEKNDEIVKTLMNGEEILDLVISAIPHEEDEEDEEEDEATRASTAFCNAWLDAVGLSVTGRLLERIMRIPQLTSKGCEHLSSDLNYIVNVFSALGLDGHPHPLVSHVAELSTLDGDLFKERISNWDRSDPTQAAMQCIEQRVALMRGVH